MNWILILKISNDRTVYTKRVYFVGRWSYRVKRVVFRSFILRSVILRSLFLVIDVVTSTFARTNSGHVAPWYFLYFSRIRPKFFRRLGSKRIRSNRFHRPRTTRTMVIRRAKIVQDFYCAVVCVFICTFLDSGSFFIALRFRFYLRVRYCTLFESGWYFYWFSIALGRIVSALLFLLNSSKTAVFNRSDSI